MRSVTVRACAPRARDARFVPAASALAALVLALGGAHAQTPAAKGAQTDMKPQEVAKATTASADLAVWVGAWQARLPTGLVAGSLVFVPDGGRLAGAFVGYDYDRPQDMSHPAEGPPPKIAMRTGSLLRDLKLEGQTLTFKMTVAHPSPPPGRPASFEVTGEVKLQGGDTAELKLSAPVKPEPLVLLLTRE